MLSLINFRDHPSNRHKKVFFFKDPEHANYFEVLLVESKITFEKQIDEEGDQTIYYGVKISDFKTAKQLNYLTIGRFRKPFISDRFFRIFIILLSILVLSLAFLGAYISNR